MTSSDPLPAAQQHAYENMCREFDRSQYNKVVRIADSILSLFPEHGETLAMKGLTMYKLEKADEGVELIKKGISLNPRSAACWHCLGSCHVHEKKFPEALKAFKMALTIDKDDYTILRDLSSVAVHVRDWEQFFEVRQRIVALRPSVLDGWVALACAHKMLGHPKLASAVLEMMPSVSNTKTPEYSEIILFRVELALEQNMPRAALELLKSHDDCIQDQVAKLLLRAQAHTALGQKSEAEEKYIRLVQMGICERDCIAKIARLRKIPLDESRLTPKNGAEEAYMTLLDTIAKECPGNDYIRRHALDCVPISDFKERLSSFAAEYIRRMVPSLWSVLKSLYSFPDRVSIIAEVFSQWEKELIAGNCEAFGEKNPCHLLWIWAFLATHWRRLGEYDKALDYINKSIEHTPTLELLYLEKSKIYFMKGEKDLAEAFADDARKMDLQDKCLSSKAAKVFFRNNNIEGGERLLSFFCKPDTKPEHVYLLTVELQCYWYEKEVGEAYFRKGDIYSALQNLLLFELHQTHNRNDLYDFHNYVFRRSTMRYWFDAISREDNIGENKMFLDICPALIRCYMHIFKFGEEAVKSVHVPRPPIDPSGLPAEEVKHLNQLRKEYYLEDIDLSEPMKKGEKYLNYLLKSRGESQDTQLLAIEYYTLLKKPLLVARALLALKKHHHSLLMQDVMFKNGLFAEEKANMDNRMLSIIETVFQSCGTPE